MAEEVRNLPPAHAGKEQVNLWWHEAELAARTGQKARSRRFLRWILACCPDDEEAWLWLASLAPSQAQQIADLIRAYDHLPTSQRLRNALHQARTLQLESTVGRLKPLQARVRCLPDHRCDDVQQCQARSAPPTVRHGPWWSMLDITTIDIAAWLAFLLPLLAYLFTACSTVYNLDSAEFAAAVHVLGIVRATGYPLYLLVGKAFSLLLPVGEVAFRLNVMSAVCAAGTVTLLYRLLWKLTRQRAAALAAALLFAFSYYFWAEAVVAEVYTLHTLLMVSLLLLLLRWETTRDNRLLAACGLLYGLSFGNHMSMLLLAPGLTLYLWLAGGKGFWRPGRVLAFLLPCLLGLGIYAYIPLRYLAQPAFNYAGHYDSQGHFVPLDLSRPANLWWLVSGQGFRTLMFDYSLTELLAEVGQAAHRLWGTFLGIGLLPALLGVWVQARQRPRYLALFGLIFVVNLAFFVNYRVVDKATMFIPTYVIGTIWMGEGYAWLIHWVQGYRQPAAGRSPVWAWGLAALAVVALVVNWPLVDVHADVRARDRADVALNLAEPQAIIFGWWTSAPPLHYRQVVEGQRPDVLIINRFLIGAEEMYALIDRSLGRRPVYVMELDEGLLNAYQPVAIGPMFELTPRARAGAGP